METGREWTHPDVSLPQLLSLVRAFVDMLRLASGFQPSAAPAFWRIEDIRRALGWASLLEQIIAKISAHKEDKGSRKTLDKALQAFMLQTLYPEGLPKLSCEILGEAKKLLIHAISHALGSCNGQIESLVAAADMDEGVWEVVFQRIKNRFMVVEGTKSVTKALELATSVLNRSNDECCCQQRRQEALSYLLDSRTLYKISGATVLFKCSESQWKAAIQSVRDQVNMKKSVEIAELCCLHMSQHRQSVLIRSLMQPCNRISCSIEASELWQSAEFNTESVFSKATDAVEGFLAEITEGDGGIWWSLPPILVAAALRKGSLLFKAYTTQISRHIGHGTFPETIHSCTDEMLEAQIIQKDNLVSRSWCLQFVHCTVEDDDVQQDIRQS